MKKFSLLMQLLFVAVLVINVSCDDDDEGPKGRYEEGVFIVNEGNFLDADGTISFFDVDSVKVTSDIFGKSNSGKELGDVVQSMTIDDDYAYIVVNNSNKMEVVNVNTFESVYKITDLALPRYFTVYKGKGYITEWVSFEDAGQVSVVDLKTREVVNTITTDDGAENIIEHKGYLYVSNNFTNTVSVIDPGTEKVIKTIEVGDGPGALLVDDNDKIWVICGGTYNGEDGQLVQLDPSLSSNESANSTLKTIELNMNISAKAAINEEGDKIFFTKGNLVYAVGISATTLPEDYFIKVDAVSSFYGIGIDPETDVLYLADSKSFAGNGEVYRYKSNGTAIDHFTAGRGPNGFAFHD